MNTGGRATLVPTIGSMATVGSLVKCQAGGRLTKSISAPWAGRKLGDAGKQDEGPVSGTADHGSREPLKRWRAALPTLPT